MLRRRGDACLLRYSPNVGFSGIDTFQYRLADEINAASNVVTVTVTVAPPSGSGSSSGGSSSGGGGGGGSLDLLLLAMLAGTLLARRSR